MDTFRSRVMQSWRSSERNVMGKVVAFVASRTAASSLNVFNLQEISLPLRLQTRLVRFRYSPDLWEIWSASLIKRETNFVTSEPRLFFQLPSHANVLPDISSAFFTLLFSFTFRITACRLLTCMKILAVA